MRQQNTIVAMAIIGTLFFIFGFVTWLNGSLIPFLKVICDLNEFQALFVTFAFYIAYTVMAYPMSFLLERTGYKRGMSVGLGVMAIGSLLFIPAALSGAFLVFLVALFVLGTGLTILQTASNPYIVLLGPIESAARRISIMGLINKFAGVIAPMVFTALIFSDIAPLEGLSSQDLTNVAHKLIAPYIAMSIVLVLLIVLVEFSSLQEIAFEDDKDELFHLLEHPRVIFGAVALFFYVGIEVIAGDTIGLYAQSLGMGQSTMLTSYTMGFMVLGYIAGVVLIPRYLSQKTALLFTSLLGILFTFGIVFGSTKEHNLISSLPDSVAFVALLGLSNALVWPTIWPLVLEGLGKHTAKASALLIMSIAGGALLPLLFGKIASSNMQMGYLLGLVCYGVIIAYAKTVPSHRSIKKQPNQ